jgi:FtsZ-binding cell division protein ZapB
MSYTPEELLSLTASFEDFVNKQLVKMAKDKKSDPKAAVRTRGLVIFPAESPKVKDNKDHFPINSAAQARNALARANQYSSAPEWWKGSLQSLVGAVTKAVKKHYPSIEVSKAAEKPGKN